ILMAVSSTLREYWWIGSVLTFAAIFAWRGWTRSPEGRLQWDRTLLGPPHVGALVIKIQTAPVPRTPWTMLESGVPVLGALAVVGDMMSNQVVGRAVERLGETVKRGGTLASGLAEHANFPTLAVHMVRVGEETGRLEEMLLKTAETFETDVRTELKRMISLLEP